MSSRPASRAPLAGVAYVVLVVASLAIMGVTPSVDESGEKIVSFYRDNNEKVLAGSILFALAAVAFIFFITALRRAWDGRGSEQLRDASFAGGTVAAVGMLIFAGLGAALSDAADDVALALEALNALNVHMYLPLAGGTVTFLVASGLGGRRTGLLPNWLSWAGIVIALLVLTPLGFFAFLGSIPWVLVTSIVLLRQPARAARTTPAG